MPLFQIMSDIHLETYHDDDIVISEFIHPTAPYLILAGDICRVILKYRLKNFLKQLSKYFKYIFYILGNHEYYSYNGIYKNMNNILNDLYSFSKEIKNLIILNRKSIIIEDVLLSGCTLWSDIKIEVPKYVLLPYINKQRYIKMFKKDLNYLYSCINYANKHNLKLLVITHHSPTYRFQKTQSPFESLYYSNLDCLLQYKYIHTWIFGHTHENIDMLTKNGTRILSNQKGKKNNLCKNFSLKKIFYI